MSFDAPARRHQEVVGADGAVVIDNYMPGPDRPGTIVILRRDGSRDEVGHQGANAYERMVTAFAAEVAGETEPRWSGHRLDPPGPPPRPPPRGVPCPVPIGATAAVAAGPIGFSGDFGSAENPAAEVVRTGFQMARPAADQYSSLRWRL